MKNMTGRFSFARAFGAPSAPFTGASMRGAVALLGVVGTLVACGDSTDSAPPAATVPGATPADGTVAGAGAGAGAGVASNGTAAGAGAGVGVGAAGTGGTAVSTDVGAGAGTTGAAAGGTDTTATGSGIVIDGDAPALLVDKPADSAPTGETGIRPGDAVDMLFVVDNSTSMGDKQAIFRAAVPDLIDQMVKPPCFNVETQEFVPFDAEGLCSGAKVVQVFEPVTDIHIAVISSSLGSHGLAIEQNATNPICDDATFQQNDKAQLMPFVRPELALDVSTGGFLVWNSDGKDAATVASDLTALVAGFQAQVDAVGEDGCGFEAPLEAAYRFLVEPNPYATVDRGECTAGDGSTACAFAAGTDTDLLAQRAAFLRPNSHLVVVFLTDENDCSVMDRRQGYLTLRPSPMAGSTAICDTDPNSPCCHSCQGGPKAADLAACGNDPAVNGCTANPLDELETGDNALSEAFNLRCFDQKRRFGNDFLYPTKRYVGGFTAAEIINRENTEVVPNPLFANGRVKEQVFMVGIVGTPWQDTAEDAASPEGTLNLSRTADLNWSLFLPTAEAGNAEPVDPFNRETMAARTGTHPITQEALGGPADPINSINGHDRAIVSGDRMLDDLQYSCIFPLAAPKDCAAADALETKCDCTQGVDAVSLVETDYATGNPLCRDPATGTYGTTQYFAKAYPAPRMLEVLYGMGSQGVLSSICPRNPNDPGLQDFGFRPAIRALLLAVAPPEKIR